MVGMSDLPVACTLSHEALKARKADLLNVLLTRANSRHELTDGYQLRFPVTSDILSLIAETIESERQCCRFLRFTVTVDPDGEGISLDLTGPPGTRDFLSAMFAF